ncbi:MAG: hypothetical protein KJ606_01805 [Chloroflexi bacterium]|nr:hypothetical protein [Chloroflexota bacterium]
MRRLFAAILLCLGILAVLLSACGSTASSDPAARAVETYLEMLVAKDSSRLASLSCAAWESTAIMELDSLQAVETRLEGLACRTTGADGGTTLVSCDGKIVATYDTEDQELDLSVRTYHVVQEGGEYLACGYR